MNKVKWLLLANFSLWALIFIIMAIATNDNFFMLLSGISVIGFTLVDFLSNDLKSNNL